MLAFLRALYLIAGGRDREKIVLFHFPLQDNATRSDVSEILDPAYLETFFEHLKPPAVGARLYFNFSFYGFFFTHFEDFTV